MFLYFLDLLGTGVFAATGAMVAARGKLDVFGALVLAFVTAVGGGTIRDGILGSTPVFWVTDTNYLTVVCLATALTLAGKVWWHKVRYIILLADAIGLGVFTVIGVEKALSYDVEPVIAVIMGVLTGAGGGVIRDVLAGRVPMVLRYEIYATASIAGGLLYIVLYDSGFTRMGAVVASAGLVVALRLLAIYCRLSLPRVSADSR